MKLERRHGLLGFALAATALVVAAGAQSPSVHAQRGVGDNHIPTALQGDWEKVSYPALDRLIRERAAQARAKEAAHGAGAVTLARR